MITLSIPREKKIEAINNFESQMPRIFKLDNFKYTTDGYVVGTPYKPKGAIPLRDKLVELPDQPEVIYQESGSVLSEYIDELEAYQL